MPLPAALLERLAKRGIVKEQLKPENESIKCVKREADSTTIGKESEEVEEIIAECYDNEEEYESSEKLKFNNQDDDNDNNDDMYASDDDESAGSGGEEDTELEALKAHIDAKFKGYSSCPNKSNVWHECTLFCKEFWGKGRKKPTKSYARARKNMLMKYPLPKDWHEVYDPGTGRYYYWDVENDSVSWLPPSHPRSIITDSAAQFREERYMVEKNIYKSENMEGDESDSASSISSYASDQRRIRSPSSSSLSNQESDSDDGKVQYKRKKYEIVKKLRREIKKDVAKRNKVDPMDPSAYSDVPMGGWNDGLHIGTEAKTGVDTTVTGPLYQMRPYPSPGAVLKANAKKSEYPAK